MARRARSPVVPLTAPGLLIVIIFFGCLAAMVRYSLAPSTGMARIGSGVTAANYAKFLGDSLYVEYLTRSVRIAAYTTAVTLVLGYAVAYFMTRCGPALRLLISLALIVQFFTAYVVRSYALMLVLGRNGIVNRALLGVGLIETPLRLMYNELGVAIGLVFVSIPFMVFPILGSLTAIDRNLEAAAESLGANPLRTFWSVTVPLSLPGVVAGVIIVYLFTLTAYVIPGLLGGGYFEMIANLVYDKAMSAQDYPFAAAAAVIAFVITAAVVYALQKGLGRAIRGA
jgi:ABC-type spermidine/putrescine transport system permease subunit I